MVWGFHSKLFPFHPKHLVVPGLFTGSEGEVFKIKGGLRPFWKILRIPHILVGDNYFCGIWAAGYIWGPRKSPQGVKGL